MARKEFTTEKGTTLPLLNLRGKEYLQVAHRLVWLNEEVDHFTIETNPMVAEDDVSVVRAVVSTFKEDSNGQLQMLKRVSATKRETKSGFADHLEKAETGAIGRAIALLGFGTQFTADELEEGNRLADSPMPTPGKKGGKTAKVSSLRNKKTEEKKVANDTKLF